MLNLPALPLPEIPECINDHVCCRKRKCCPQASMAWSTCPPDVLAKCFNSQHDYIDNSAAACVCTSWRDTFRGCAEAIKVQQNPLNEALLSATYLQQFKGLDKVELGLGSGWPQQHSGSWLRADSVRPQNKLADGPRWLQTMQSIPPSCSWLMLDGFLPPVPFSEGAFSQLSNLQRLHIYSHQQCEVFLEDFAHLLQLQSLSLVGQYSSSIIIHDSLHCLPAGITNLQFKFCSRYNQSLGFFCLKALSHLHELRTLDMSNTNVSFEEDSEVVDLHNIKVMVLDGAQATGQESVVASLMTATQLQDLSLRKFWVDSVDDQFFELQLGSVLTSLSSLQKLDVTACSHVLLGSSEYSQLRLHSFACDYAQLNIVEAVPFKAFSQPFQTREGITVWPSLQIEGQFPHFGYQHWTDTLPMTALTHLTLQHAHVWPLSLFLDSKGQALPNLLYLNISFASLVSSCHHISFPVGSKVQQLYIAGTCFDVVDLEECTSLTSLGIIQAGYELPGVVSLPTSLERLCLYNVLRAKVETQDPELHLMSNVLYLKVGGRVTNKNIMKRLPQLPSSLLELDLWDGVVTELDQLTLLTRLKKLRMPLPPSPQQLSIIKRLRQLRHIEVTTHEGTYGVPATF